MWRAPSRWWRPSRRLTPHDSAAGRGLPSRSLSHCGGRTRRGPGGGEPAARHVSRGGERGAGALPGARCVAARAGTRWSHETSASRFAHPQKPRLPGAHPPPIPLRSRVVPGCRVGQGWRLRVRQRLRVRRNAASQRREDSRSMAGPARRATRATRAERAAKTAQARR